MKLIHRLKESYIGARNRWKAKTPVVFKRIIRIGIGISSVSVAIHEAVTMGGGMEPEWWTNIYPYLVGIPAGAAAVAKFTQTYDKDGNPVHEKPNSEKQNPEV